MASRSFQVVTISSTLFLVTSAVNLEMPLYRTYARAAGLGEGAAAFVFAAYVAGLLPTLLLFGGLSERIGRKPVILGGLTAAALATALVIVSPTLQALFVARVLQGLGVGLSVGAGTAYLADVVGGPRGATWAASYAAVTTSLGFGTGALLTSSWLMVEQTSRPLSYWLVLLPTLLCLGCVSALPAQPARGGALLRLPWFPKRTLASNVSIAVAWAVTGVIISLLPAQLAQRDLSGWAGHALFLVNGTGALLQPLVRRMESRTALRAGFIALPLGYALLMGGTVSGSLALVLVGASIAGSACYGFTYLGGLAEISRAGGEQRARAVSGYFLFAYLGFSIPSVVIGLLSGWYGLLGPLLVFGGLVALACVMLLKLSPRPA
jgi:MFS family permease